MHYEPKTKLGRVVNNIEETLIAVILGLMTLVTFVNVVRALCLQHEHPLGLGDHGLPLRLAGPDRGLLLRQEPARISESTSSSTWSALAQGGSSP